MQYFHPNQTNAFDFSQDILGADKYYGPTSIKARYTLFALFFGIKAFLPGLKNRWFYFSGCYVQSTDIVLILMGIIFILAKVFFIKETSYAKTTRRFLYYPLCLLIIYELISMTYYGDNYYTKQLTLRPLYTFSALTGGIMCVSGLWRVQRYNFIRYFIYLFAFTMFVYLGLSFIFPSFRGSSEIVEASAELGWIRVYGPLIGAATVGIAVIPAIAWCLSFYMTSSRGKTKWLFLTIFFIAICVLSGSRVAVLGVFCLLGLLSLLFIKKTIKFIIAMVIIGMIIISVFGIPERFKNLKDTARIETYKTGIRASTSGGIKVFLCGRGHGSFYSNVGNLLNVSGVQKKVVGVQTTAYGFSLVNSHNTYIQVLVETGLIGFIFLVIPLFWLAHRCFGRKYRRISNPLMVQGRVALLGTIATFFLMAVDAYIVKNFWIIVPWVIFAVCAAETVEEAIYVEENNDVCMEYTE